MAASQETLSVVRDGDFVSLGVVRLYQSGMRYESTLHVQLADVEVLQEALSAILDQDRDQQVSLQDGQLNLFLMPPNPAIHFELKRPEDLPFGGYDTLDLSPETGRLLLSELAALR